LRAVGELVVTGPADLVNLGGRQIEVATLASRARKSCGGDADLRADSVVASEQAIGEQRPGIGPPSLELVELGLDGGFGDLESLIG
jgi:hypothetical protein